MKEDARYVWMAEAMRAFPGARGPGPAAVVFTPGHLGDVLHAAPMLKALRAARPGGRIVWLAGPWCAALARRWLGTVDEVRVLGPNLPPYVRGRREWMQGAARQMAAALALRREGVAELIAPMDAVGRFLANGIRPAKWIGIGEKRPPRVRDDVETFVRPYEKDRCEADALAGLLEPLGIWARASKPDYAPTPGERAEAAAFLGGEGVDPARPLAVLAPGSGWSGKNWLPERFGAVAEWLARERGFQVAWAGGPGEERLVPRVAVRTFDWVGRLPLPLFAAALERARLFVGNDAGLLHFAAAMDVPTVSVWGPTSPGKWGPKGSRHRLVRRMERCPGCVYWDWRETCKRDGECMKAVAVADVVEAIRDVLRGVSG